MTNACWLSFTTPVSVPEICCAKIPVAQSRMQVRMRTMYPLDITRDLLSVAFQKTRTEDTTVLSSEKLLPYRSELYRTVRPVSMGTYGFRGGINSSSVLILSSEARRRAMIVRMVPGAPDEARWI